MHEKIVVLDLGNRNVYGPFNNSVEASTFLKKEGYKKSFPFSYVSGCDCYFKNGREIRIVPLKTPKSIR